VALQGVRRERRNGRTVTYQVPAGVMIQARRVSLVGPCAFDATRVTAAQLAQYLDAGHVVEVTEEAPEAPKRSSARGSRGRT
jgi:hypothetical protein